MTFHDGQLPPESDRFFSATPTSSPYPLERRTAFFANSDGSDRPHPLAIASFSLAILALLATAVSPVGALLASLLAILCGAAAIATILLHRGQRSGFWMAALAIAVSALPLILAATLLFTPN